MSIVTELRIRLRAVFRWQSMEHEMDAELHHHLERDIERLVAAGVTPAEARRRARATFGGVEAARDAMRQERGLQWLLDAGRDVRLGVRSLARRPLYWVTVAVTLGLGIGATTAIFSIVDMLLLRPVEARDADRLVVFGQDGRRLGGASPSISLPTVRDLQALPVFEEVAAFANEDIGIQDSPTDATRVFWGHSVTGNYFTMLGLQPTVGRFFTADDEARREPLLVLSHAAWQGRYGGARDVVGREVWVNGIPFRIAGVAPERWRGMEPFVDANGYIPLGLLDMIGARTTASMERRGADFLRAFGRLRPGATLTEAREALRPLAERIGQERGEATGEYRLLIEPEVRSRPVIVIAGMMPALAGTFMALALLALLIACVNVGNLVLSRTLARGGELAVRRALGASRGRVARELLVESVLLGVAALVIAVPVAWGVIHALSTLSIAADVPIKVDVRLDRTVLAFASLAAVVAGLVAGLVPALRGSASDPGQALSEAAPRTAGSARRRRLGNVMLTGQLAFSLVLVIAGALFLRSLSSVTRLDLGLRPDGVALANVDLSLTRYSATRAAAYFRRAEDELRTIPGVTAVGRLLDAPMGFTGSGRTLRHPDGRDIGGSPDLAVQWNTATPGAFEALRLRVIEGRPFDATDDSTAPRRAIINDVAARAMWPGQDRVVGERVRVGADSTLVEVVGVVRRVTQEFPTERPVAQVFMPYAQVPTPRQAIFVRSDAPMDMTLDAVRRVLRGIDPAAAVSDVRSYASFLHEGKAFFLYRVGSALTLALGVLGLLQTLVGLYGVIAYGVSQRAREFGIRLALGARHSQLVRGIVGPQSRYVAAGLTIGLVGAAVLLPAASAVLAVSPRDPWIYTGCAALLGALSAVALYLPARRAARAGPMRALRSDQP